MQHQASELQKFAARLAQGPAFLILGENSKANSDSPMSQYSWSGIYTSQVDGTAAEQFRADWRTVLPEGAMSTPPSRSQTELQVRYLFGGHHLPETDRPPSDALQEADARMRCLQELSRLVTETVTPRGVIVIEGWTPGERLDVRDFVPTLRQLGTDQAHLFSSKAWAGDPFVKSLSESGQLVLHESSLDETLTQLDQTGSLPATRSVRAGHGVQHVVALGDAFAEIDIHTWNQVRRSARPVDLELLSPPVFSSEAARYQEFRNFAGAPDGAPRWRGLAAGMNIRRDFEGTLANEVESVLKERDLPDPIVVTGQTATGKSIALAALAMGLARAGEVAVLHQSRRGGRPSLDDIDMYAAWAEDQGADSTVLVWDGMVHPSEYEALSRQLRNRGRKVLVVGSAYVTDSDASRMVEAPAELTQREADRLLDLLRSFGVVVETPKAALDTSFLAFLYHTLPETEYALRSGLAHELRAAEKGMEKLVRERGTQATNGDRLSAMAAALQAAGLSLDDLLPRTATEEAPLIEQTFEERSSIQRVTTLVLVAARHGVSVPIDLALRVLGREGSESIRDALNSFDIIRELDDDNGEYFLTTRSRLEAELLTQHDISLEVEIEVISEVIRNVRVHEGYLSGPDEVQFVVSLLERVGPNSQLAPRYKRFFGLIAAALREKRESGHRPHPRLVLQESIFTRNYSLWRQENSHGSIDERIADLEHNRDLLDEVLNDSGLTGLMRLSLTVELASTLGSILHAMSADPSPKDNEALVRRLDDILHAVLAARAIDPGNLHPIDVLAWSTRDAVRTQALAPHERLHRLANAIATLESVDRTPLSDKQRALLDRRGAELNKLLGDDDAFWDNLRELERNADPAATYFLAKFEAENGAVGEQAALNRLQNAPLTTQRDWRCAQLLLDLTWKKLTGRRLLQGERVPVHLSLDSIRQLLNLSADLSDADLPDRYKLLFVKGLAQFLAGDHSDAKQTFREVENLTRQLAKRIYTTLLIADETGRPQSYTGRVEWADARSGQVWVNELGTSVRFEPRLFSTSQQFSRNQQLPPFMLGFKLSRGAVAEPRSMYREPRKS